MLEQRLVTVPPCTKPSGSNRVFFSFSTMASKGTPCCKAIDRTMEKESNNPETRDPCLSAFKKTSPKRPSGYCPVLMYNVSSDFFEPTLIL